MKLSAVQFMLNNHTVSDFSFFSCPSYHPHIHFLGTQRRYLNWGPGYCYSKNCGPDSHHTARLHLLSSEWLFEIQMIWVMVKSPTATHTADKLVIVTTVACLQKKKKTFRSSRNDYIAVGLKGSVLLWLLACILPLTHVFTFNLFSFFQ